MLTLFIFFSPVFYGLSDGGIHFSAFFFSVKPSEQKKTIAFYELLHPFRDYIHFANKSPYMYLEGAAIKVF